MTEMHDVVEMLLNRMRDYPEDFYNGDGDYLYNKWLEALNTAKQVMTEEEKLAIEAELQAAKRAVYMGAALKTMMSPDVPVQEDVRSRKITTGSPFATTSLSQSQLLPTSATTPTNIISQLQHRQREAEIRMQQDLINAGQL